ncbi:hypothetical protein RRG08_040898 [Elysia crispata]|uniref:Uncharacterized protein n=1 Tax=Elysia crispata TaxID=231223 RepID=A0AAE0YE51_9GAST|nr:hypothetical protein RRG08_040898 [Elysia crispata]
MEISGAADVEPSNDNDTHPSKDWRRAQTPCTTKGMRAIPKLKAFSADLIGRSASRAVEVSNLRSRGHIHSRRPQGEVKGSGISWPLNFSPSHLLTGMRVCMGEGGSEKETREWEGGRQRARNKEEAMERKQ